MNIFTATVVREGKWWMVSIPELDGLTQARRLSEAAAMAREFVAATLDTSVEEVAVILEVRQVGGIRDVQSELDRIREERSRAERLEKQAIADSISLARSLANEEVPLRDIGTILGVSHQRAHQLVTAP